MKPNENVKESVEEMKELLNSKLRRSNMINIIMVPLKKTNMMRDTITQKKQPIDRVAMINSMRKSDMAENDTLRTEIGTVDLEQVWCHLMPTTELQ